MPKRIVSICPSNTEILFAIGAGDLLVGVDSYSDYPPQARSLPKVGPDLRVSIAKIRELNPDLVIASLTVPGMERNIEALKGENLPYIVLSPISIEETLEDIKTLGRITGTEDRAEELSKEIKAIIESVRSIRRDVKYKPKLYWEWWPKPFIAACRHSWVNDMIEIVGGINIFSDIEKTSAEIDETEIIKRNPDILFICWCGAKMQNKMSAELILEREGWDRINAISEKRVHCVPESLFGRPGPRIKEALMMLSQIINSERSGGLN